MTVSVFLVGAGPGDPGLITRRALELIRSCDVLLYDRLVAPSLLDEAPTDAQRIFVGKTPGGSSMPQASIDALIVEHARTGRRVVRLKGGDPFVFGRGADEGQALAAAGVPFEIVPGVTAAVAVPAYAGIPVTHGGTASSFAVVTAHESGSRPGADDRFKALAAGADTLVMLMGVAALDDVAARLISAGRSPDEPVALVERGTTPHQRTIVATLSTAVAVARREQVTSPTTIVVGQVVKLRDALRWFDARPLFGKRVVVTRPAAQAGSLSHALAARGADVMRAPMLALESVPESGDLDAALVRLERGDYEWVLFTSVNAVDRFFEHVSVTWDVRIFGGTKVVAVGPATSARLLERGLRADLTGRVHTAVATVSELGPGTGRVLLPRSAEGLPDVIERLQQLGWDVDEVVTYRTVKATPDPAVVAELRRGAYDVVTFASPSAVEGFVAAVGVDSVEDGNTVATIGPSTSARARRLGLRVDVEAQIHTADGLVEALEAWAAERGTISR